MSYNLSKGRIQFHIETTKKFRREFEEKVINPMFEKWINECIRKGIIPQSAVKEVDNATMQR